MLRSILRKLSLRSNSNTRPEAISGRKGVSPSFRSLRHEPLEERELLSVSQISTQLRYYSTDWYEPRVSDDGHHVAFTSRASLVPEDTNGYDDVYVVDLQTDELTWVSRPSDGSQPNNGSWKPEISPDGRYVAFMSRANDLLPEDQDPSIDLFVFDRDSDGLECITADLDGDALSARFSGDNQRIVYEFEFNDTNPSAPNSPTKDIVLYDRTTDERRVVSTGYDGESCAGICWRPEISRDGGTVVFQSRSSNLVPNDSPATWDVFLYDVSADTLECISSDDHGVLGNADSTNIRVSADGRFVTFQSRATNLEAPNTIGYDNIYLLDRATNDLQAIAGDGTPDGATATIRPDISLDGRYVIYNTTTRPGNSETASSNVADVFVYDRLTDTTQCVTVQPDGSPTGAVNAFGSISGDGTRITFLSDATTLTDGPVPNSMDVFAMENPLAREVTIVATAGNDTIEVHPAAAGDSWHRVVINGSVSMVDSDIIALHIDALGGQDRITVYGTDQDESATLASGSVDVVGETYEVHGVNVETIEVNAGTGDDEVGMTGSTASNRFYSYPDYARLADSARSYSFRANGFDRVAVEVPGSGRNYAYLYDSPGNDLLDAKPTGVTLQRMVDTGDATTTTVTGCQRIYAYASGNGGDEATLTGSELARNRFYGYADYGILTESRRSFYFYARGFDAVTANSPGDGYTYAYLYDSSGADELKASPTSATMDRATGWSDTTANGFKRVYAYSTRGGDDTAQLTGSDSGGNYYRGTPTYSTLNDRARSFYHYTRGFHSVVAIGSETAGAGDRAYLYDSRSADTLVGRDNSALLRDTAETAYQIEAKYFDLVYARSTDGKANDTVDVDDSLVYDLIRTGKW